MSKGAFVSQPSLVAGSGEMVSIGSNGSCLPTARGRRSGAALCRAELNCFMYNITEVQKLSFLVAERFQSASASFWLSCSCQSWAWTRSGFPASEVDGTEEDAAANGSTTSAGVLLKP